MRYRIILFVFYIIFCCCSIGYARIVRLIFSNPKGCLYEQQFLEAFKKTIDVPLFVSYFLNDSEYDAYRFSRLLKAIQRDFKEGDIIVFLNYRSIYSFATYSLSNYTVLYVGFIDSSKLSEYQPATVFSIDYHVLDFVRTLKHYSPTPCLYILYDNSWLSQHLKHLYIRENIAQNYNIVIKPVKIDSIYALKQFIRDHNRDHCFLIPFLFDQTYFKSYDVYRILNTYNLNLTIISFSKYITCKYACLGYGIDYYELGMDVANTINNYIKTGVLPSRKIIPLKVYLNPEKCSETLANFVLNSKMLKDYTICR